MQFDDPPAVIALVIAGVACTAVGKLLGDNWLFYLMSDAFLFASFALALVPLMFE